MIKLFPFGDHLTVITDTYDTMRVDISYAFEYENSDYVVITSGLIQEGEYTIMRLHTIHEDDNYSYQLEKIKTDDFTKICDEWETFKYGGE